jgi:hypothetical protein
MSKDFKMLRDSDFDPSIAPNAWHNFEALDRCHMIIIHITEALCNHPALTDEEAELAESAVDNLMEIYQRLGQRTL